MVVEIKKQTNCIELYKQLLQVSIFYFNIIYSIGWIVISIFLIKSVIAFFWKSTVTSQKCSWNMSRLTKQPREIPVSYHKIYCNLSVIYTAVKIQIIELCARVLGSPLLVSSLYVSLFLISLQTYFLCFSLVVLRRLEVETWHKFGCLSFCVVVYYKYSNGREMC